MADRLIAVAEGLILGEIKTARGRLSLVYADEWQKDPNAYPLSLSMPLTAKEYSHSQIEPWLWGLLPDNEIILSRWGSRFHVSPRNPFALLSHVGEECPGAVQFALPEKVDSILKRRGQIQWLTDAEIAERLKTLKQDPSAWRSARDTGQFSLAGAQPKTAFIYRDGRWGIPSGRIPTTHIFKPPNDAFHGHAENEHVCLQLAKALGFPAAESRVLRFEKQLAIVVQRYDRVVSRRAVRRVHQEDMCQALGCPPTSKYQNQGGPNAKDIIDFLRVYSSNSQEDVWTFVQALGFNWLIGGTDAHAKNYSMLIGSGGRSRLAPLYDVASILPYDFDRKKLKLAMSIGREYLLEHIVWRNWAQFSDQMHLPAELLRTKLLGLAVQLPDALEDVVRSARTSGLDASALNAISNALRERAATCVKQLT